MIGLFLAGLAALIIGAELLVRGASRLALSWGISPLVVGLTIVALGTSAPEIAVSVGASLEGKVDIAMGNVVGSNIFNVLFILGLSALLAPLSVNRHITRQEVPIMIGATLLLIVLSLDGRLNTFESIMLVILLIAYTAFLIVQSRRQNGEAPEEPLSKTLHGNKKGSTLGHTTATDNRRPGATDSGCVLAGQRSRCVCTRLRDQRAGHRPDHRCGGYFNAGSRYLCYGNPAQ